MTICALGQQLRHSPSCNAKRGDRDGPSMPELSGLDVLPRLSREWVNPARVPQQPQLWQIVFDAFAQLIIIAE